jgi:general stress protein 26
MDSGDKQKIIDIMKECCLFAFLATSDGDQPRVRPVSPIVEYDLSVWLATFAKSRKVKQINQNPKISLAFIQHPSGDKSVTIIGEAEIIEDLEQKKRIWKLAPYDISQHFPKGPESEEFCLLKINPKRIEWWDSWEAGRKIYEPER